ncbi:MAG: hypothetical protein JST54_08805 [Deltaproteobacteria bacterium]|nr:hypothetical protein [Deltaproteobacteria bacterium]
MTPAELHDRAWRDMRRRVIAIWTAVPLGVAAAVTLYEVLLRRGVGERDAWSASVIAVFAFLFGASTWIKLFRCPQCRTRWMPGKTVLPVRKNCRKCGFELLHD